MSFSRVESVFGQCGINDRFNEGVYFREVSLRGGGKHSGGSHRLRDDLDKEPLLHFKLESVALDHTARIPLKRRSVREYVQSGR